MALRRHVAAVRGRGTEPRLVAAERRLPNLVCDDRCGDTGWQCSSATGKQPVLTLADGESRDPGAADAFFLDRAIMYFRTFIDAAPKAPDAVRAFRSDHVAVRC